MTDTDESQDLQKFRRTLFPPLEGGESIPEAFLTQLRHLVRNADVTLAIRRSATERTVYWIAGCTLGWLTCTGSSDAKAAISGLVLRLDGVAQIEIDVEVAMLPGRWSDDPGISGRVLKIGDRAILSASPNTISLPAKVAEIDAFIDRVLAVYAGRTT